MKLKILAIGITLMMLGVTLISAAKINNNNTEKPTVSSQNKLTTSSKDKPTIFYPTDDSAISLKALDDSVYGSLTSLATRNRYGSDEQPYYWEHDILIRFDLSSIPAKTSIVSAKLYLYYFSYECNNPENRSLTAYPIKGDWSEKTVTYNTSAGYDPIVSASAIVPSAPGRWMSWDVTSDVQKFVNGEKINYGWQIMDEKFWGNFDIPITNFYSKENGALIPYLEIIT